MQTVPEVQNFFSYTHLLYKAQDPFSTCRQSQVHNNFLSEIIFKRDQSLLHRSRNSGRDLLGGTNSFAGQLLHPSPVQSSRSIKRMKTVPGSKQFLYEIIFLTANSLSFTDQETQEEIYWVEPTPLQVSSYTHLLYKAQDPFSACRQYSPRFKTIFSMK